MAYTKTNWVNDSVPAINATNLNNIEEGIYQAHKKIEQIEAGEITGSVSGDTLPIGSMIPYGNSKVPSNWLICDGSEISRTTYANLFNVIGTNYGEGDGNTTFNLPNKKGKVSIGLDATDEDFNTIGKTGGEKKHTLTISEMPSHKHNLYNYNASGWELDSQSVNLETNTGYNANANTTSQGADQPHNNLQPYEVDCWIIKAFQSAGIVAEVANANNDSQSNVYSCDYINNNFNINYIDDKITPTNEFLNGKRVYTKRYTFSQVLTANTEYTFDVGISDIADFAWVDLSNSYFDNSNAVSNYNVWNFSGYDGYKFKIGIKTSEKLLSITPDDSWGNDWTYHVLIKFTMK